MLSDRIREAASLIAQSTLFTEGNRGKWERFWNTAGGSFHRCLERAQEYLPVSNPANFCAQLEEFVKGSEAPTEK